MTLSTVHPRPVRRVGDDGGGVDGADAEPGTCGTHCTCGAEGDGTPGGGAQGEGVEAVT